MPDIFISYGRQDRTHAERIASILEGRGWSVWWDRKLLAGEQFSQAIEKEIDQTRCVVVLWSTSSVTSSWVRDEATEGTQRNILVPVVIDGVELPLGFRQHHAVTIMNPAAESNPSAFDDLVAAVDSVLRRSGPRDMPAPLTSTPPAVRLDARAERSPATVPRSYLYAAVGAAALLALALVWQSFRSETTPESASERQSLGAPVAGPVPPAVPAQVSAPAPATDPAAAPPPSPAAPPASGADVSDSPAESSGVVVSGRSQDYYSVLDAAGTKQLGYLQTEKPLNLFPGNYQVDLHGTRRTVAVAAGRRTTLRTGTASVSGTGKDYFSVLDATGKKQLGYLLTNRVLELFPGEYQLMLHGASTTATIRAGRDTTVAAGRVVVPGSGATYYSVLDAQGETRLAYVNTNVEVELLPGTYIVDMNNTRRTAQVSAGGRTVVDR